MRTPLLAALSLSLAATLTAPVVFAASHGADLPPAVKARQAHMQLYGFNAGVLFAMAKGDVEYDAAKASAAAANLVSLSDIDETSYWVEGTDNMSIDGTRALPAAVEDMAKMQELIDGLNTAAKSLAATAGEGLDAVKAGIGPVGQACSACHEAKRAPAS